MTDYYAYLLAVIFSANSLKHLIQIKKKCANRLASEYFGVPAAPPTEAHRAAPGSPTVAESSRRGLANRIDRPSTSLSHNSVVRRTRSCSRAFCVLREFVFGTKQACSTSPNVSQHHLITSDSHTSNEAESVENTSGIYLCVCVAFASSLSALSVTPKWPPRLPHTETPLWRARCAFAQFPLRFSPPCFDHLAVEINARRGAGRRRDARCPFDVFLVDRLVAIKAWGCLWDGSVASSSRHADGDDDHNDDYDDDNGNDNHIDVE